MNKYLYFLVLLSFSAVAADTEYLGRPTTGGAAAFSSVDAADIDSASATDGWALTADGAGNSAFEAIDAATYAQGALADTALQPGDVDDAPVDGATADPISSNWAYDHGVAADPHSVHALLAGRDGDTLSIDQIQAYDAAGLLLTDDGGTGLFVEDGGFVGVGSTNPGQELEIVGDIELEATTSDDTGVIYKDGVRFIHNFQHPTGDTAVPVGDNLFIGENAGNFTTGSTATTTSQGSYNTGVGVKSLTAISTGAGNTSLGYNALNANTSGDGNTAIGRHVLRVNSTSNYNTGIGDLALFSNTTGSNNTGIGASALYANTTGGNNTAIAPQALRSNISGFSNMGIGVSALRLNTTGSYNLALGTNALFSNQTGTINTAIAYNALYSNVSGNYNVGIGYQALYSVEGDSNIAIGVAAGRYETDGSTPNEDSDQSIYIGRNTETAASGGENEIVIGYAAEGSGSNTVTIGNSSITENNFTGEVVATGGFTPAKVTADPCGGATYQEGTLFYNDTSNYFCFCDGTNDVQMHDPATACF